MEEALIWQRFTSSRQPPNLSSCSTSLCRRFGCAQPLSNCNKISKQTHALQQGQVFIVFWDAPTSITVGPKIGQLNLPLLHKNLPISNRFNRKKALSNQKSLSEFGQLHGHSFWLFWKSLPNRKEAVVIITGDHGEEFFEQGHLFHNSTSQIFKCTCRSMKFGPRAKKPAARHLASQMDIFPSILNYLSGHPVSFLEGNSLFQEHSFPFAVTARFNACNTPYEFCIHNKESKLILQFIERGNALGSKDLRIVSIRNKYDQVDFSVGEIKPWVDKEFGPALKRLFQ